MEGLYGHSPCNLLVNIKGLESTFFLFLPLTKLPHPSTIYRYSGPVLVAGYWHLSCVKVGPKGRRTHFCESVGTYKTLLDIRGLGGQKERVRYVLKSGQRGDTHICEPGRRRTIVFGEEYSWDSAEG